MTKAQGESASCEDKSHVNCFYGKLRVKTQWPFTHLRKWHQFSRKATCALNPFTSGHEKVWKEFFFFKLSTLILCFFLLVPGNAWMSCQQYREASTSIYKAHLVSVKTTLKFTPKITAIMLVIQVIKHRKEPYKMYHSSHALVVPKGQPVAGMLGPTNV